MRVGNLLSTGSAGKKPKFNFKNSTVGSQSFSICKVSGKYVVLSVLCLNVCGIQHRIRPDCYNVIPLILPVSF